MTPADIQAALEKALLLAACICEVRVHGAIESIALRHGRDIYSMSQRCAYWIKLQGDLCERIDDVKKIVRSEAGLLLDAATDDQPFNDLLQVAIGLHFERAVTFLEFHGPLGNYQNFEASFWRSLAIDESLHDKAVLRINEAVAEWKDEAEWPYEEVAKKLRQQAVAAARTSKNDTKNDTAKKVSKKTPKRRMNRAAYLCVDRYKATKGNTPMKEIIDEVADETGESVAGLAKRLEAHPDLWKTDT